MHLLVKPGAWVVLRLPSDSLKVVQLVPNATIQLPKLGSFPSNLVLSRPYYVTYELLDRQDGEAYSHLRRVPTSELYAETIAEEDAAATNSATIEDKVTIGGDGVQFELVGENGDFIMRSNRETIDDSAHQTLTTEEIEALKRDGTDAGKELIAKLMLSHSALDKKTAFSLAKYKLLKTKKYLRQFTVLPLDVSMLVHWMMEEKDGNKIMEIREETLALASCWANVHHSVSGQPLSSNDPEIEFAGGRWLVVDDTGGLIVAAMAERMGILNPEDDYHEGPSCNGSAPDSTAGTKASTTNSSKTMISATGDDIKVPFATRNTLTMIHSNAQPNLSLLKYFHYSPDTPSPAPSSHSSSPSSAQYHANHPLSTHLHTLSWLQLLHPSEDVTYATPPPSADPAEIATWKSGKRGSYFRKRRRWARARAVVEGTRRGGFDGLVVASSMEPVGILRCCIPLLRGGAQLVVYSASVEPLVVLADVFSMSRRTAFISGPPEDFRRRFGGGGGGGGDEQNLRKRKRKTATTATTATTAATSATAIPEEDEEAEADEDGDEVENEEEEAEEEEEEEEDTACWPGNEDFPLNPTTLLNVGVQTTRARRWQVLPGRTHPLMTGRGGAEGYLFTATRVLPARGRIEARGKFRGEKRRRVEKREMAEAAAVAAEVAGQAAEEEEDGAAEPASDRLSSLSKVEINGVGSSMDLD